MKFTFTNISTSRLSGTVVSHVNNNRKSGESLLWLYSYLFSSQEYQHFPSHHKITMVYVPITKHLPKGELTDKRLYHHMMTRTR